MLLLRLRLFGRRWNHYLSRNFSKTSKPATLLSSPQKQKQKQVAPRPIPLLNAGVLKIYASAQRKLITQNKIAELEKLGAEHEREAEELAEKHEREAEELAEKHEREAEELAEKHERETEKRAKECFRRYDYYHSLEYSNIQLALQKQCKSD